MTIDDIRRLHAIVARQQQAIEQMQRTIDEALALLEPAVGALNKLAPLARGGMTLEEFAARGTRAQAAADQAIKRGTRARGRKTKKA